MAEYQDLDDKVLLQEFKEEATKEKAYTELVRRYQERLYWHVRRMVVNHEDANDVLQNVLIKVWKNLGDFRAESNVYTWMYRIATNESLTYLDSQKRKRAASLSDHESGLQNTLKAEEGFDGEKLQWQLHNAILDLPENQRAVFNIRYYDVTH